MASAKQVMLGRLIDTAFQRADDDPDVDDKGYIATVVPADNDELISEDEDAFEALSEDLSPGEAQRNVDFMKPLSDEERAILAEFPDAEQFTRVDDAEHDDWLLARSRDGYKGMDHVLEDAIYGEHDMDTDVRMEREDVDSPSLLRRRPPLRLMRKPRATSLGAMSPKERIMLARLKTRAWKGEPRALQAIFALKKSGALMSGDGDLMGLTLTKALKYATAPVWWPAKKTLQATKWAGQKLGIINKGANPQQVRLAKLTAARKRQQAAEARARAADAESEAEMRTQQSLAAAADAEADAADAAALSKEAAMRTAEIEANPESANNDDDSDD